MSACRWLSVSLVVAAAMIGCSSKTPPEPVPIGFVAVADGGNRQAVEHARHGLLLAVEEANRAAEASGGRRVIVHQPDIASKADVGPAAVRLITINKVAGLLGGFDPEQVETLARTAQSYNLPLVAPGPVPERTLNSFVFLTGLAPAFQGQILARYAAGELKVSRAAVVVNRVEQRSAAAREVAGAIAATFVREFRKDGRDLAGEWTFQNAEELKALPHRLAESKASVILVAGTPEDVADLQRLGLAEKVPILFGGEEGSRAAFRTGSVPNILCLATAFGSEPLTPRAKDFFQKYRDRFGDPPDVAAGLVYDSARLLIEAIHQAPAVEGTKLRETLAQSGAFDSLTGPLTWGEPRWASRPGFVIRLENGQIKDTRRYDVPKSE